MLLETLLPLGEVDIGLRGLAKTIQSQRPDPVRRTILSAAA